MEIEMKCEKNGREGGREGEDNLHTNLKLGS
jgi:hypothetical protein